MEIDNVEEAQDLLNEFLLIVPQLPGFYDSSSSSIDHATKIESLYVKANEMGENLNLRKIDRSIRRSHAKASEWSGFFVSRGWVGFQLKDILDYNTPRPTSNTLRKEYVVKAEYARIEIDLKHRKHLKTDYFRQLRNIGSWSRTLDMWDITDLVLQSHLPPFINWNTNPFEVK